MYLKESKNRNIIKILINDMLKWAISIVVIAFAYCAEERGSGPT